MTAFCLCLSLLVLPAAAAEEETTPAPAETTLAPVADPVAEPVADPVAQPAAEPVADPVAQPAAEPVADPAAEPIAEPQVDNPYTYVVTIEYGSFQFWYDWGEWDVDQLTYTKDASSNYPAATTTDGAPGWYGFDGVTNRIGVYYQSVNQAVDQNTPQLQLTFTFEHATDISGNRIFADGVAIEVYDSFNKDTKTFVEDVPFTTDVNEAEPVTVFNGSRSSQVLAPITASTDSNTPHEYFLSLSGAPAVIDRSDDTPKNVPFISANAISLGRLIISIALVDPTT